ncbi:MAG: aminoacyl-tRNA hydrolase [Candidatus Melainabacteria bacterium 35_41]|jgi:aminoacyl-tRNA hydrolase|nr:MAG: aminoacyl-tRNA hydrolase [Candidatus Melainabacteria bacterium 35_41]
MKLIAGLGNVGDKYCFTRHNAGFMVLDKWALDEGLSFREEKKLKCFLTKLRYNNEDLLLVKPTTFMNLSGEAVRAVMDYYKIEVKDILIIYDDIALDLGRIRFRANGSDGGHNGIKSIIQHVGTKDFDRLKVGIGPQPNIPSENYVLQNFPKEQHEELKDVLKKSIEAVEYYLKNDIQKAQNLFN